MKTGARFCATRERGYSLVEVMVALVMFAFGLLALAHGALTASSTVRASQSYTKSAAVAQSTLDSLRGVGWAGLNGVSGADTVQGVPMSWSTSGTNPRRVIVVVQRQGFDTMRPDTFVTYVAQ